MQTPTMRRSTRFTVGRLTAVVIIAIIVSSVAAIATLSVTGALPGRGEGGPVRVTERRKPTDRGAMTTREVGQGTTDPQAGPRHRPADRGRLGASSVPSDRGVVTTMYVTTRIAWLDTDTSAFLGTCTTPSLAEQLSSRHLPADRGVAAGLRAMSSCGTEQDAAPSATLAETPTWLQCEVHGNRCHIVRPVTDVVAWTLLPDLTRARLARSVAAADALDARTRSRAATGRVRDTVWPVPPRRDAS